MENERIFEAIKSYKNGSFISVTKSVDLENGVTKETKFNVRKGVSYANMRVNEGKETGSLPWGHWVKDFENVVIEHKDNLYLRLTAKDGESGVGADVLYSKYMENGKEITKEEAMSKCAPKFFKEGKPSPVICVKFSNIKDISTKA